MRQLDLRGIACVALAALTLFGPFACDQTFTPATEVPDDLEAPGRVAPETFVAFLSSNRSRLIRDDANEGSAALTVVASDSATFEWTVNAPEGLLDVSEPDPGPGTTSVLTINRVLADPGASNTTVNVQVIATSESDGEQRIRSINLTIVRPQGALTTSISSLAGNRVDPGAAVILEARVIGGRPFPAGDAELPACSTVPQEPGATLECEQTGSQVPPNDDAPYQINWSADGLDGGQNLVVCSLCSDDGETISRALYTAPSDVTGNIVFTVRATDASGNRVNASLPLVVNSAKSLTITRASAQSLQVSPGSSVELTAEATGGEAPYTINFSIDPQTRGGAIRPIDGEPTDDESRAGCNGVDDGQPCVVSYHAAEGRVGSDLVVVEVLDSVGARTQTTISLLVTSEEELRVVAASENLTVTPGEETNIEAVITGGTPPYTACFDSQDFGGSDDPVQGGDGNCEEIDGVGHCSCNLTPRQERDPVSVIRLYDAPLSVTNDTILVRVRDAVGATASAVVPVRIAPDQALSIVVASRNSSLVPGGSTELVTTVRGGTPPYSICIRNDGPQSGQITPGGTCSEGGFSNCTCDVRPDSGSALLNHDYTAPLQQGSDGILVRVFDATGAEATDTTSISFSFGGGGGGTPLDLVAFAETSSLIPGDVTTLRAEATGGTGSYQHTFTKESTVRRPVAAAAAADGNGTVRISETATIILSVAGGIGSYDFSASVDGQPGPIDPPNGNIPGGEGEVELTFTPDQLGARDVRILVTDTGQGLSREVHVMINVIADDAPLAIEAAAESVTIEQSATVNTRSSTDVSFAINGGVGPFDWTATLIAPLGNGTLDPEQGQIVEPGGSASFAYAAPVSAVGVEAIRIDVTDTSNNESTTAVVLVNVIERGSVFVGPTENIVGANVSVGYIAPPEAFFDYLGLAAMTDTVSVRVADGVGSKQARFSIRISRTGLNANPSAIPDCISEASVATLLGDFSGGVGPFSFEWIADSGVVRNVNGQNTSWTPDVPSPAEVNIRFRVTDQNDGSSAEAQVVVNVGPVPTATYNDPNNCPNCPVCEGNPLQLFGGPDRQGLSFRWTGPDGQTYDERDPVISNAAAPDDGGTYTLEIDNGNGCITRTALIVDVIEQPVIATQPLDQELCPGITAFFSVELSAGENITYQWEKDGIPLVDSGRIVGVTTSQLRVFNTVPGDVGDYVCVVTSSGPDCENVVSSDAGTLTLLPGRPTIDTQPQNQSVCESGTANFSIEARGSGELSYEWFIDGAPIGGDEPGLEIENVQLSDNGSRITCRVTDDCGNILSAAATLTVTPGQPLINAQPQSATVCAGTDALFSVGATGTGELSYQWRLNGQPIGPDSPNLTLENVSIEDDGAQVDCVITDTCGEVTSAAATLSVDPAEPEITQQPQDAAACEGGNASFEIVAVGTGVLLYQWFEDGQPVGGDSPILELLNVQLDQDGAEITCEVTDVCGATVSAVATLTVNPGEPGITQQPQDTSACEGGDARFDIVATGTGTLSYQWFEDGNPVGGDSPTLDLLNVQLGQDGARITCEVSDDCGSVVSEAATLSVSAGQPQITGDPQDAGDCEGATVQFAVTAEGTGTLHYQWLLDGDPIGPDAPVLELQDIQPGDNGAQITCEVSDDCGSVVSQAATLSVFAATGITTQPRNAQVQCGDDAEFSLVAEGEGLTYQWQYLDQDWIDLQNGDRGGRVSGADTDTLTISTTDAGDAGEYRCVVIGVCGDETSRERSLSVEGCG